ncbi:unnamed protein product, partial [Iphiclides podalirius]
MSAESVGGRGNGDSASGPWEIAALIKITKNTNPEMTPENKREGTSANRRVSYLRTDTPSKSGRGDSPTKNVLPNGLTDPFDSFEVGFKTDKHILYY